MDFADQLRILQDAQGDPALLALATVDLAHSKLSAAERARIKEGLIAAAVPHWCDRSYLAALLETTTDESDHLLGQLRTLTVVEPFPARGESAINVHETARLALRKHLRTSDEANWRTLSARAREHVAQGHEPHARIEALYHLFAVDQTAAAAACETLHFELSSSARPEDYNALALALKELTVDGWLEGAAEFEAMLYQADARSSRGEASQLEPEARRLLDQAREVSDSSGLGRAHCLLGDTLLAKGKLDEALQAYREFRDIFQRLAATDPSDAQSLRREGIAHSRVGDVYLAQGRLDEALTAFHKCRANFESLGATDPLDAGLQRELAVAFSKVADIHQAEGRIEDALTAYRKCRDILARLAAADPLNAGRQRDLGVAHSKVGDVYLAQERLDEALTAFDEFRTVLERLVATDPSNAVWQRDLALAHSKTGESRQAQGRPDEALTAFGEYLTISRRLAATDPSNVEWQRDLALAHNQLGQAFRRMRDEARAQSSFRSAVEVMERAVAAAPAHVTWETDLENLRSWVSTPAAGESEES